MWSWRSIPIAEGASAAGVTARARVMRGHKMAVAPIAKGEPVRKYDQIIGFATTPIAPGDWVHTQNVEMHDFARDYRFAEGAKNDEVLPPELRETFEGYVRPGGKTGTRNYIGILTSVNCSASAARFIAREVERSGVLADHPEIDGVVAVRARHRLRACGLWRGLRRAAADPVGLRDARQSRRRADGRARLRGVPDRPHEGGIRAGRGRSLPDHDDPGDRRHQEDRRRGRRAHQGDDPDRGARQARDAAGLRDHARAAMRRLGRLFGHHGEPGARRRGRRTGAARRHRDPLRDAGNLRRRASAHAPRRQPRGRREAGRAHQVVGSLLRPQRRRDEQQSLARQQGGRAHHHSGEVARRRRQGRHHHACARSTNMPSP